jgi:hypothetical protein
MTNSSQWPLRIDVVGIGCGAVGRCGARPYDLRAGDRGKLASALHRERYVIMLNVTRNSHAAYSSEVNGT